MIDVCPHGFLKPASCVLCMEDGPVAPPRPDPTQLLKAERIVIARFDTRCARYRNHEILAGDSIGYVTDVGWVCSECAS